jgi:hypothetical protein
MVGKSGQCGISLANDHLWAALLGVATVGRSKPFQITQSEFGIGPIELCLDRDFTDRGSDD